MSRTIGSLGSVALLVSSITGPSLVVIPLLFQQAGWLTPLLTFVAIALLSGAAALFVVEAMSSIEGNEAFQASIEFTTIAHLFLGKRWHVVVQLLLYLAMQTLVIASLLESFQSMDAFLISVAHKTCAVSFTEGWICVDQIPPNANSAFTGYILGSFGTLITLSLVLPLSLVHLVDNIIFQVASFIILLVITIVWIVIFAIKGINVNNIPVVGHDQSTVVGFVLSNFSFVTTVPAWVNNIHPSVNIRLVVWMSVLISCLIYIPIGWMGGLAFSFPNSATLLQVLAVDAGKGSLGTVARVSSFVFPLAVLITSIPVFVIVIRYNLLRGNICSYKTAVFWSAIFPWIITIPFQTNGGLASILNWASLIFTSPSNLLIPFILFIMSKRHFASAILDASVSPGTSHVFNAGAPSSTPIRPPTIPEQALPGVENVPLVIITESTDTDPESSDMVKASTSKSAEEVGRTTLDAISVPVKNRVLSPSKHRYYGQKVVSDEGEGSTSVGRMDHRVLLLDTVDKGGAAASEVTTVVGEARMRRPSLSVSLSHSPSFTYSSETGMDEFLLIQPTSPRSQTRSMRAVLSGHSPQPSMSTDVGSLPSVPTTPDVRPTADSDPPSQTPAANVTTGRSRPALAPISIPMLGVDAQESESVRAFQAFPCISSDSVVRPTRISAVACVLAAALVLTAIVYGIVQAARGGG